MKLINKDGKEYTPEDLLNPGYIKVGSKTYCEYWKKGDTIETFNTVEVDMYTEALNENQDKLNKNRLKKIHRLKRENRTLSDRRKSTEDRLFIEAIKFTGGLVILKRLKHIMKLSEQIGKNSAKIQRLRTLISQSKN
jgi:hypothetical protein